MTAAAAIVEPASHPDPHQDRQAAPISGAVRFRRPDPTRILRLLDAFHVLIAFSRQLAATLQREPLSGGRRLDIAPRFGTLNIALILARVTRDLRLAEALEARFALCADLPASEDITGQRRIRPLRDVLSEICRDLRIRTGDPFRNGVTGVLMENRGSFIKQCRDCRDRARLTDVFPPGMSFILPKEQTPSSLRVVSAATSSTGPP